MAKKEAFAKKIDITNKKASFEYFFLETYTAGIVLTGTEIKSIRLNKFSFNEGFCLLLADGLYIRGMNIARYDQGTYNNHDPLRDRKLLLQKKEIKRLIDKLKDQGNTIIPTRLFIGDNGLAKLDIALGRGKKLYDKRDTIKTRDLSRERD
jgi:SsrA-binding protein